MEKAGKCMCGAVRYTAELPKEEVWACHCGMCRQWTGGVFLTTPTSKVTFQGEDKIKVFKSSDWAERAFCSECGSSLFYRLTAPGKHQGSLSIAVGTLEDTSGLDLQMELFIDKKPDTYAFAGDRKQLTEAEVMKMFGGGE